MSTDGQDVTAPMQQRFGTDDVPSACAYFDRHGYVIFKDAIAPPLGQQFWTDVERNIDDNGELRFSHYGSILKGADLTAELRSKLPRIIDIQGYVPLAAHLMLCDPISRFLQALYKTEPTCLQTLTYKFSSEQGAHSDYHLVSPGYVGAYDRDTLAAAWLAFEDSSEQNGALIIYPGSHRLAKKRLDRDFNNDYGAYVRYLTALCESNGCGAECYEAATGEILFWHGDFVHAGGPILQQSPPPTRRSMVCHYAVVPPDRPSQQPDWVRMKTLQGSYYVPSSVLIAGRG